MLPVKYNKGMGWDEQYGRGEIFSCTTGKARSGPNTGCFSRRWLLLGARKSAPKKLNIFFQDKFYSLKVLAHYFAVFIYLPTWKNAKLIFLLILCSQTYPDVAKAWTHYYMYTLYRSPAAFYECLITVVITLFRTTTCSCTTTFSYYCCNFCFKPLTILVKCCIIDIWQGFECTCMWLISEFVQNL